MKAVIVDDVESVALYLKDLINEFCTDVSVVGIADNVDDAELMINEQQPDIVFLDIQMPGKGGFDLLQSMGKVNFSVIFVTAFNEYAIQAVRFGAIDYLLKPVSIEELRSSIERVKDRQEEKKVEIENLFKNINNPWDESNTIIINSEKGNSLIRIGDIVRIEADGNYSFIHLINNERMVSSKNLKSFEDFLENYNFIRVHRSHLVNMKFISELTSKECLELKMVNGIVIPISTRKKQSVLNKFNRF